MPIDDESLAAPINQHILVSESVSLAVAFDALSAKSGQDWWHLVIQHEDGTWSTIKFSDINQLASKLGPTAFSLLLRDITSTLPRAKIIDQLSTDIDSAKKLARESSEHVLIVTHAGQFVGVISAGVKRGGELFTGPTAVELYGMLTDLNEDTRLNYQAKAPPPTCPHCEYQAYQEFDVKRQAFICRNCKKVIEQLWKQ